MTFASASGDSPETAAANSELGAALEVAILSLPQKYRSVVILRDVEELTIAEVARALEISEDTVSVRLHRAHVRVRHALYALYRQSAQCARDLFTFPATRCDRVVSAVLSRIQR